MAAPPFPGSTRDRFECGPSQGKGMFGTWAGRPDGSGSRRVVSRRGAARSPGERKVRAQLPHRAHAKNGTETPGRFGAKPPAIGMFSLLAWDDRLAVAAVLFLSLCFQAKSLYPVRSGKGIGRLAWTGEGSPNPNWESGVRLCSCGLMMTRQDGG